MSSDRDAVVSFAQKQLGKPYVWGATGPNGFDCSGLVFAAYKAAGLALPRFSASGYGKTGQAVSEKDARPGDVVYYDEPGSVDHVGVYIGGGKMIDAPHTGANVEVDDIHSFGQVTSIRSMPQMGWDDIGTSVDKAVGKAAAAVNPFSGWDSPALAIGLKVAAVAVCGGLLIVGAKQTVNPGA